MISSNSSKQKLVIHFLRFGPYHLARLASAQQLLSSQGFDVVGLETASKDSAYAWAPSNDELRSYIVTVFPDRDARDIPVNCIREGIVNKLDHLKPSAVAIAGWSQPDALACLNWCRRHNAKAIVMSETREVDGDRIWWREAFKSRRLCRFDAALVGGYSHHAYLRKLGFRGQISAGYDVVDNHFFASEAQRWSHDDCDISRQIRPYLLASNRFIPRKNLFRLVEAFAAASASPSVLTRVDLCLLGDGEQRRSLEVLCAKHGFTAINGAPWEEQVRTDRVHNPRVLFPGFRQIEELPRFYAHALAFVHPALAEPWGLVINEAMAAGLPILSSSNVGATEELVDEGVNGYCFDPASIVSMSQALVRFLALTPEQRKQMGSLSRQLLADRNPTFSFGHGLRDLLGISVL